MRALGQEVPVNIRFCLEGMEESGSQGLEELLKARKDTDFIRSADYVCISDNYWLGKNKPCLTYGLRGCCEFFAEVKCASHTPQPIGECQVDVPLLWIKDYPGLS